MGSTQPQTPVLRKGAIEDGDGVASVFGAARSEMTYLPKLHTPEGDRAFLTDRLGKYDSVVATLEDEVIGFAIFGKGWLHHLYVNPVHQGRGLGSDLLADVKARSAGVLQLWTFEPNRGGRRFYERRGFTCVERTDGAGNEEKVPDLRYESASAP